ncbi:MAG: iron-containing redox enzyme family protein [Bacteriovorax sp.]|jgi:thiaminase
MEIFEKLDLAMKEEWNKILDENAFMKLILDGHKDRRLFAFYLCEVYNMTKHSSITQALVVKHLSKPSPKNIQYMQYCLRHALEEVGHEQMALHDLKSLGANLTNETMPAPSASTEAFSNYLYNLVETGANPVARLGYTYWAESSYEFLGPMAFSAIQNMKLEAKNITFLSEHGDIDQDHFSDVKKILTSIIKTEEDAKAVETVLRDTIRLTGDVLSDCYNNYQNLVNNKESRYSALNDIKNV